MNTGAAAESDNLTAAWIATRAGTHGLLVPLTHAGEVGPVGEIQPLPYVQPWFLGVVSIRGLLSGVVDLAAFLDQNRPHRTEAALASSRLIRFSPLLRFNCALLVDAVMGMRAPQEFVDARPRAAGEPAYLADVYIDPDHGHWRELDLQALATDHRFLEIQQEPAPLGAAMDRTAAP